MNKLLISATFAIASVLAAPAATAFENTLTTSTTNIQSANKYTNNLRTDINSVGVKATTSHQVDKATGKKVYYRDVSVDTQSLTQNSRTVGNGGDLANGTGIDLSNGLLSAGHSTLTTNSTDSSLTKTNLTGVITSKKLQTSVTGANGTNQAVTVGGSTGRVTATIDGKVTSLDNLASIGAAALNPNDPGAASVKFTKSVTSLKNVSRVQATKHIATIANTDYIK